MWRRTLLRSSASTKSHRPSTSSAGAFGGGVAVSPRSPPPPEITAVAVDIEFLKFSDRTLCRSAAFVPFRMSGGEDAGFVEFNGGFAVHLPAEVTFHHADVLPVGWALKPALSSEAARKLFGAQSPNPFCIPNPLKHRECLRRIALAIVGPPALADDSIGELQALLLGMCRKLDEKVGVSALIDALSDPFRCVQVLDFIDYLATVSMNVLRKQISRASRPDDAALIAGVDEWLVPSLDSFADTARSGLLTLGAQELSPEPFPSVSATVNVSSTKKKGGPDKKSSSLPLSKMARRGRLDQLRFISYGSGDQEPLNASLAMGSRKDWAPLTILDIQKHRSFTSSMLWLGLRPTPKLTEAITAITQVADAIKEGPRAAVAREARAFLQTTGGIESNHDPVWDAQALAIVTRWVEAFSMVPVEDL